MVGAAGRVTAFTVTALTWLALVDLADRQATITVDLASHAALVVAVMAALAMAVVIGFAVQNCRDGTEGLRLIAELHPDLVLLESFVSELPDRLDALLGASRIGDADAVRRTAHSLKGLCATFGATQLAKLVAGIEHGARENRLPQIEILEEPDRATAGTIAAAKAYLIRRS